MDKITHLHSRAGRFADVYDTDILQRKRAGANYIVGLYQLERAQPHDMAEIIAAFAGHISVFLNVVEDGGETEDVKVRALAFRLATGFIALRDATRKQQVDRMLGHGVADDFLDRTTSLRDFVNAKIDIGSILERLIKIAEDPGQTAYVRTEAIVSFDIIAECNKTFAQPVDRNAFSERFVMVALQSKDATLTKTALEFGAR